MRQHRPIRRHDVKKLSIIRNPGTGPLLERLRERPMQGPIGFTRPEASRSYDDDFWVDRIEAARRGLRY
jgi:hypothetical protein